MAPPPFANLSGSLRLQGKTEPAGNWRHFHRPHDRIDRAQNICLLRLNRVGLKVAGKIEASLAKIWTASHSNTNFQRVFSIPARGETPGTAIR